MREDESVTMHASGSNNVTDRQKNSLDTTQVLAALMQQTVRELSAVRRWRRFWLLLWGSVLLLFVVLPIVTSVLQQWQSGSNRVIALVRIEGEISANSDTNAETINEALRRAFKDDTAQAVFLAIDSPGGSPVQAGQVYREIQRLKKSGKKVYAFIGDMGASGAYYIAAAADKIYADEASVVGSIGVISQYFGYGKLLDVLGVEDRTFTAGEHKNFLNPAQPVKADEQAHMEAILKDMHEQFISAVVSGRGERLKQREHPELFSGLFWSGRQALALGLVDSNEDMQQIIEQEFDNLPIEDFSQPRAFWKEILRSAIMQSQASIQQLFRAGEKISAIL